MSGYFTSENMIVQLHFCLDMYGNKYALKLVVSGNSNGVLSTTRIISASDLNLQGASALKASII